MTKTLLISPVEPNITNMSIGEVIRAPAIKVGDNINTDVIIPSKYLVYTDPETLGKHCLEPLIPNFYERAKNGVILVAGKNFGMGSSREQAAIALKGAGVLAVIAESFARIFFRNAINNGLPVIILPGITKVVEDGDIIEIRLLEGKVKVEGKAEFTIKPLDPKIMEILRAGGLIPYLRKQLGLA